jgi:lysophospholipase L1-like esterase
MGNGQIPGQFQSALAANPDIKTVIMDGGGNDVLIGDANLCLQTPPPDTECVARIDDVLNAAGNLLDDMAAAGVQDVVYFFYPHLPEGGLVQGFKNETLDYAAPLVQQVCENAPLNCVFVDTRPAFEGHPEYFLNDGIHPNDGGSVVLANTVWSSMVANCIAQAQP